MTQDGIVTGIDGMVNGIVTELNKTFVHTYRKLNLLKKLY